MDSNTCPNCNKPLKKGRKSCSVDCANQLRKLIKPDVLCARPGCENLASKLKKSRYCNPKCYNLHQRQDKDALLPPPCPNGVKAIPLSQGKWAFIDQSDYPKVSKFNWCVANSASQSVSPIWYAKRTDNLQYMHQFILNIDRHSSVECIHGIGGTLDNTRKNLRIGSNLQNQRDRNAFGSTSKYKGVSWNFNNKKWSVRISSGDTYEFIGYFKNEIDAAMAYDHRSRELHGEFGRFNFPESGEVSALEPEVKVKCIQCNFIFSGSRFLKYCGVSCLIDASTSSRLCFECRRSIPGYSKFCGSDCRTSFTKKCDLIPEPPPVSGAVWIKLSLGKFCLIDSSDLPLILGFSDKQKWCAKEGNGNWYACHSSRLSEFQRFGFSVRMHRLIMNLFKDDDRDVGHLDGNGLNNRRSNLYITNNSLNHMNVNSRGSTGYKGVSDIGGGYFLSQIRARGSYHYLGRFKSSEEAALSYDKKAREIHGRHGRYNFPLTGERSAR